MNRKSAVLTLSIGIACAIVAVALALDLGGISSVLPIAAKGVWGFAGCAAALLVCGAFALAHKPTPQQIIEQELEPQQDVEFPGFKPEHRSPRMNERNTAPSFSRDADGKDDDDLEIPTWLRRNR